MAHPKLSLAANQLSDSVKVEITFSVAPLRIKVSAHPLKTFGAMFAPESDM